MITEISHCPGILLHILTPPTILRTSRTIRKSCLRRWTKHLKTTRNWVWNLRIRYYKISSTFSWINISLASNSQKNKRLAVQQSSRIKLTVLRLLYIISSLQTVFHIYVWSTVFNTECPMAIICSHVLLCTNCHCWAHLKRKFWKKIKRSFYTSNYRVVPCVPRRCIAAIHLNNGTAWVYIIRYLLLQWSHRSAHSIIKSFHRRNAWFFFFITRNTIVMIIIILVMRIKIFTRNACRFMCAPYTVMYRFCLYDTPCTVRVMRLMLYNFAAIASAAP